MDLNRVGDRTVAKFHDNAWINADNSIGSIDIYPGYAVLIRCCFAGGINDAVLRGLFHGAALL